MAGLTRPSLMQTEKWMAGLAAGHDKWD